MSKIIFLDVDGVLNSWRNVAAFGRFPWPNCKAENANDGQGPMSELDPLAIGLVRQLAKETGASIVFESTWRKHIGWEEFGRLFNLPVISSTDPNLEPKAKAVRAWLDGNPEVTDWIVIDDDAIFEHGDGWKVGLTEDQIMKFHRSHVQTHMVQGFGLADFARGFQVLQNLTLEEAEEGFKNQSFQEKNKTFGLWAMMAIAQNFGPDVFDLQYHGKAI